MKEKWLIEEPSNSEDCRHRECHFSVTWPDGEQSGAVCFYNKSIAAKCNKDRCPLRVGGKP